MVRIRILRKAATCISLLGDTRVSRDATVDLPVPLALLGLGPPALVSLRSALPLKTRLD